MEDDDGFFAPKIVLFVLAGLYGVGAWLTQMAYDSDVQGASTGTLLGTGWLALAFIGLAVCAGERPVMPLVAAGLSIVLADLAQWRLFGRPPGIALAIDLACLLGIGAALWRAIPRQDPRSRQTGPAAGAALAVGIAGVYALVRMAGRGR